MMKMKIDIKDFAAICFVTILSSGIFSLVWKLHIKSSHDQSARNLAFKSEEMLSMKNTTLKSPFFSQPQEALFIKKIQLKKPTSFIFND